MMLDLNEAERLTKTTQAAEAQEAKNRRSLATVVIGLTCMVLLAGQSAIPRRPDGPQRRALFGFGLKDKDCSPVCINGGECDPKTGKCVCPSGFSGAGCETANVEECDPPCGANSFCNENLVCECLNGFIPPNCEEDFCANVVCQNGGTCINEAAGFKCDCTDDYVGTFCENDKAGTKTVFITSKKWNGNLGGLVGADDKCQDAADDGGLDGTYKAWLSGSTQSAASRLSHSANAYVRPDGDVVANDWDDLLTVDLDHQIIVNEFGYYMYREVWTGTDEHGNQHQGNCIDWTSADDEEKGLEGYSSYKDDQWTDHEEEDCDEEKHLYCFEQ